MARGVQYRSSTLSCLQLLQITTSSDCCYLQVFLNQAALGPLVTSVVFTWNLLLQNKASEIPQKVKQDLVPTMVNGEQPASYVVQIISKNLLGPNVSVLVDQTSYHSYQL